MRTADSPESRPAALTRRQGLAALAAGGRDALAAQPLPAQAIRTDTQGRVAGPVTATGWGSAPVPVYEAGPEAAGNPGRGLHLRGLRRPAHAARGRLPRRRGLRPDAAGGARGPGGRHGLLLGRPDRADHRPSYRPEAAQDAGERCLAWLQRSLKG